MKKSSVPISRGTDPSLVELVEITPVILGGSPTDPKNKMWLTRAQHVQYVRFWNTKLAQLRSG